MVRPPDARVLLGLAMVPVVIMLVIRYFATKRGLDERHAPRTRTGNPTTSRRSGDAGSGRRNRGANDRAGA